ncbi:MAG TPA: hypothetical protein VEL77_04345 [Rugosimonospora sp.]|nr:hypothetical protein [Rugosimonospora sp.]
MVEVLGLRIGATEDPDGGNTIKGTKFEILFPALFPLVGPGAITPMEKVPSVVRSAFGIVAWISMLLTKLEARFMLVLLELFQVTLEFATNPEPLTVRGLMSWPCPAMAPLGVIDVIVELIVGEAPR